MDNPKPDKCPYCGETLGEAELITEEGCKHKGEKFLACRCLHPGDFFCACGDPCYPFF